MFPPLPGRLIPSSLATQDDDGGDETPEKQGDSLPEAVTSTPTSGAKFTEKTDDLRGQWPNAWPIETALAAALTAAVEAREWTIVSELARVIDRRVGRELDPPSERTLRVLRGGRR